ncbi:MAG: APC family permease [Mycobacterium kyogaense]|uniref:APC family permease n=1 Tax=Mycobacterium kyogaense TaxID=2212479 RepID=UPI002FF914A5
MTGHANEEGQTPMNTEPRTVEQADDVAAGGLRRNSMTWVGAALLGAIIMSPASGLYFNFTPTEATAGSVVPLIFLIAIVVTLPTALSYAALSRSLPSAGSAYTWVRQAMGPGAGVFAGWILNGFYLLAQIVLPGIGALFFNDILNQVGIPTGYLTWAIGVMLMTVVVAAINFRGIDLSLKGTVIFMVLESVVVFALMATIFIVQSRNGSFTAADVGQTFTPSAALGGTASIFAALVFGIQANVGFDAVSTLAEETHTPRKYIPIATVVAVLAVGAFWVITAIGFVAAFPVEQVAAVAADGGTPVSAMAHQFWGGAGQLLISIIAFTSITAIYLAQNVASSRALYAMGRAGTAPAFLARLKPGARVPGNAMTLGLVVTVLVTLLLGALLGTASQYNWSATMSSSLALLTYLAVNIANIAYHARNRATKFHVFMHGVVPVVGIAVVCFVIYKSYLASLWNAGWTFGRSVQIAVLIWLLLGVCWVMFVRRTRPDVMRPDADAFIAPEAAGR